MDSGSIQLAEGESMDMRSSSERVMGYGATGMTSIRLWSPADETVHFYEKNGFRPLSRIRTHPSDGRQIVEMEWCA